jgi:hypothetical protein
MLKKKYDKGLKQTIKIQQSFLDELALQWKHNRRFNEYERCP